MERGRAVRAAAVRSPQCHRRRRGTNRCFHSDGALATHLREPGRRFPGKAASRRTIYTLEDEVARPRASGITGRAWGAGYCRAAGCSPGKTRNSCCGSAGRWRHTPWRAGRSGSLLCGRCYTLARGAQTVCLSVRGRRREVNCSAGGGGGGGAAVFELERARSSVALCFLPPPSQNLCECVVVVVVFFFFLLLMVFRRGYVSRSLLRPPTLEALRRCLRVD